MKVSQCMQIAWLRITYANLAWATCATSRAVSSQSKTNAASSQSKEKSQCTDWRVEETGHGTSSAVVAKPKLFFADVGFAIAFDLSSTSPTFVDLRGRTDSTFKNCNSVQLKV